MAPDQKGNKTSGNILPDMKGPERAGFLANSNLEWKELPLSVTVCHTEVNTW